MGFVDGGDSRAGGETFHDFAEIAGQGAWPAEGIDAVRERRGEEFTKTRHPLDAGVVGRQGKRNHRDEIVCSRRAVKAQTSSMARWRRNRLPSSATGSLDSAMHCKQALGKRER